MHLTQGIEALCLPGTLLDAHTIDMAVLLMLALWVGSSRVWFGTRPVYLEVPRTEAQTIPDAPIGWVAIRY